MDETRPTEPSVGPGAASDEERAEAGAGVDRLSAAVESLLFVADQPVPLERLAAALDAPPAAVHEALDRLRHRLAAGGLHLQVVAGGYQLGTRPEHADLVRRFLQQERGEKLSRGALETLAIVAYRQPITRGEIEQIRGVRSDWHIERLLERHLIREMGRRQTVGRPVLFGTTELFLRYFGLPDLADLPAMGERGVQILLDAVR